MAYHGVPRSTPLLALPQLGCSLGTMVSHGVPSRLQYRLQYSCSRPAPPLTQERRAKSRISFRGLARYVTRMAPRLLVCITPCTSARAVLLPDGSVLVSGR